MATEYIVSFDWSGSDSVAVIAQKNPDGTISIVSRQDTSGGVFTAPWDGSYNFGRWIETLRRGEELRARDGLNRPTSFRRTVERRWWQKVIWQSLLVYLIAGLTAAILSVGFKGPWYAATGWFVLYLSLAAAVVRSWNR